VLGKDTIDYRVAVPHPADKNHAIGTGSHPQIARELTFQRFDIAYFPLKSTQGKAKLVTWLGGKLTEEINHLRCKVYGGHVSSATREKNFVRPFS